jgi:hypothetical protein
MKKILLIFSLILFVLLISGFNPPQQPSQTQEGLGTLTGKVYGNVPNTVIYKAEVIAEGGGKTYKTSTDKSGNYVLHLPADPNLIQNGDFSNGQLTPWQVLLINIKDYNYWSVDTWAKVLHWVRGDSDGDGGYVGAYQSLDIDTTGKTKVVLSLDVVICYQELDSDGWAGGEYPARVSIFFEDSNGNQYEYKKCFILEGSTINYSENNVTSIPKDTWYHFEVNLMDDPNVASQIQAHPYIKEIRVGGNGWDFEGTADNIYLGVQ